MRGVDRSPPFAGAGAGAVLVTGASGFIGSHLVSRFARSLPPALRLVAVSRSESPRSDGSRAAIPHAAALQGADREIERRALDLTRFDELDALLEELRPVAIVHLAAMSRIGPCEDDPEACRRINVGVVERLARYCARERCHLTHVSSDFVFDGGQAGGLDEDSPTEPRSVYGRSKLDAERAILASQAPAAILRTVLVYGERSPFVELVRTRLEAGGELALYDDHWRTPTFVDDLVEAIDTSVSREAIGVYHVAGEDYLCVCELGRRVAGAIGFDPARVRRDRAPASDPRPRRTGFIIDRARRELGYRPRSLALALRSFRSASPSLSLSGNN